MSGAPIIRGTRKFPSPARIGTTTKKTIPVPCIVTTSLYESPVRTPAVVLGELGSDQEREEPGQGEEEPGGRDVEDPDPLVVDRDQPAGDLAALPGRDTAGARP